ncbi:MAG: hypothetical protein ACAH80_18540 [Alphaproteobacteria bacterium]
MRLTDLDPRWIHPDILAFRCPCCRTAFILCKRVKMRVSSQQAICVEHFGYANGLTIVPAVWDEVWTITGTDFNDLTVTPSVDASRSGHWHGHVTQGEVR